MCLVSLILVITHLHVCIVYAYVHYVCIYYTVDAVCMHVMLRPHRDLEVVNAMRGWMGLAAVTYSNIGLPTCS